MFYTEWGAGHKVVHICENSRNCILKMVSLYCINYSSIKFIKKKKNRNSHEHHKICNLNVPTKSNSILRYASGSIIRK